MKRTGIAIKGFKIGKGGRVVRDLKRLDVSARLRQKTSRKMRVGRKVSR